MKIGSAEETTGRAAGAEKTGVTPVSLHSSEAPTRA